MSDNIQHIDTSSEEWENTPKALRDHVDKLQKALKSVTEERDAVRSDLTTRALKDVLSGAGFKNPKRVERDLLQDKVDPLDEAAVQAWLEENGDDYAKGSAQEAAPAEQGTDPDADAYRQLRTDGATSPADMSRWEAVEAEINDNMSPEELLRVYAKHGI